MRTTRTARRPRSPEQALEDGRVLAVDRKQLGAGLGRERLHQRAGDDEALLVRQRHALAGAQRRRRDGQAGEADDHVDDGNGVDHVGQVAGDLDAGQRGGDLGTDTRVGDDDDLRLRRALACSISGSTDQPAARATTS